MKNERQGKSTPGPWYAVEGSGNHGQGRGPEEHTDSPMPRLDTGRKRAPMLG